MEVINFIKKNWVVLFWCIVLSIVIVLVIVYTTLFICKKLDGKHTILYPTPIQTSTQQHPYYPTYLTRPAILGWLKRQPIYNPYGGRGNVFRTNSYLMYSKPYIIGSS